MITITGTGTGLDSGEFTRQITQARMAKIQKSGDMNIIGATAGTSFYDECLIIEESLETEKVYYFKGKIKRLESDQKFWVKLVKSIDVSGSKINSGLEQNIITVNVQGSGDATEWVDVEFVFSPISSDLNTLVFEMARGQGDVDGNSQRTAAISYIDLVEVKNQWLNDTPIIKVEANSFKAEETDFVFNKSLITVLKDNVYKIKMNTVPVYFYGLITKANYTPDYANITTSNSHIEMSKTRNNPAYQISFLFKE